MMPMGSAAARVPMRASSLSSKTLHTLQNFSVQNEIEGPKIDEACKSAKKTLKNSSSFLRVLSKILQRFNYSIGLSIDWLIAYFIFICKNSPSFVDDSAVFVNDSIQQLLLVVNYFILEFTRRRRWEWRCEWRRERERRPDRRRDLRPPRCSFFSAKKK